MRRSFFYGYVILALCFLNMVVMRGVNGSFSVFYVALLEEFPWSHASGASIASINFIVYALASPLVGLLFDRFGPRLLMPLGGALVSAGLFLSSFADSLGLLYFGYGLVAALGQGALGFVSHGALISNWFARRRATAIGIATAGQGLGTFIMAPLTQVLITQVGWRATYIFIAMLIFLAVVPVNAVFQRRSPEEVGQLPDGTDLAAAPHTSDHQVRRAVARDWTLRQAFLSLPFWSITIGHLALGTALFMINTHIVAHLVHNGFEKLLAAFGLGLLGFIRVGGTPLWGFVSDRLGRDKAYLVGTLIALAGLGCVVAVGRESPIWLLYVSVVLYGVGHSAGNPTYGALIGDIFSGRKVGLIFGFLEISFGLGSALGAWLGGFLFDVTGSYRWPFSLCLIAFTISYLAVHSSLVWQAQQSMAQQKTAPSPA